MIIAIRLVMYFRHHFFKEILLGHFIHRTFDTLFIFLLINLNFNFKILRGKFYGKIAEILRGNRGNFTGKSQSLKYLKSSSLIIILN